MSLGVPPLRRALFAEALGTFALVFAGTGAAAVDALTGGAVTHVGVSLVFGLVVLAMIQAVGDVSGAHLNPAVTVAFWAARRFPGRHVAPYALAQTAGALAGSLTVRALVGGGTLGATRPAIPLAQAFGVEAVLSFLLVFVVLSVALGAKERGLLAGVAVGSTVALAALVGGPLTGASMNPARSLAPALVSGEAFGLWIYLTAPFAGALVAVAARRLVHPPHAPSADEPG